MINTLDALMLVIDTGVLTLVWLVQLVIYPGFIYYSNSDLKKWHPIYTKSVTYVVLPLMFSQLIMSVYLSWTSLEVHNVIHLVLISIAWGITFFGAVPLHQTIDRDGSTKEIIVRLIRVNRYRTLVWTLVWGLSMTQILDFM